MQVRCTLDYDTRDTDYTEGMVLNFGEVLEQHGMAPKIHYIVDTSMQLVWYMDAFELSNLLHFLVTAQLSNVSITTEFGETKDFYNTFK